MERNVKLGVYFQPGANCERDTDRGADTLYPSCPRHLMPFRQAKYNLPGRPDIKPSAKRMTPSRSQSFQLALFFKIIQMCDGFSHGKHALVSIHNLPLEQNR